MRPLYRLIISALAVLPFAADAIGQQAPNYSLLIGRGAGVTGYRSVGPCATAVPVIGSGASADPACSRLTLTNPATGSTITIDDLKTFRVQNSLILAGTDATTMTFPSTSATIARTDAGQTFTGTNAFGVLTATSFNGNTWTAGTGTLTLAAGKTLAVNNTLTLAGTDATVMTFPSTSATIARTDAGQTFTGTNAFGILTGTSIALNGATIGSNKLAVTGDSYFGGVGSFIGSNTAAITTDITQLTVQNSATDVHDIYDPVVTPGWFTVDNIRSVAVMPLGSTATNVNALGLYGISNNNPGVSATGNMALMYGLIHANANDAAVWGLNPVLSDSIGVAVTAGTGKILAGMEIDFSVTSPNTIVQGISLLGTSVSQPAGADGFSVGSLSVSSPGTAYWANAFVVAENTADAALTIGAYDVAGANVSGIPIRFGVYDSASTGHYIDLKAISTGSGTVGLSLLDNAANANGFVFKNAASGSAPSIYPQGTDTNIGLTLLPKGSGVVTVTGDLTVTGTLTAALSISLTSANILVGNASNVATAVAPTGDVTINNTGVTAIGATKVTSAMLNSDVYSTAHSWGGTQTFTAPVLGAATGTSLAIGGATLGSNALAATGSAIISGNLAIGTTSHGGSNGHVRVSPSVTGAVTSYSIYNTPTIQSDVTTAAYGVFSSISTQAAAFTLTELRHFSVTQGTIGAGSAITTQTGFMVGAAMAGATNNYAFRGALNSAAGRYNIYMDGTADNYLAGNLGINDSSPTETLTVGGTASITGALTYGGVTLTAAVTGTGKMVLDTNPVFGAATGTTLGLTGKLTIQQGLQTMLLGADTNASTLTDATTKTSRIGFQHYTLAEEPMALLYAESTSTTNRIAFGGGTSSLNAATTLDFYTAANNTTVTGTARMRVTSAGDVGIATTSPGYKLHVVGDIFASGNITCAGTCGSGGGAASQWTTAGSNIYYTGGNVGFEDATPAALLTVGNGDLFQVDSSGIIAAAAGITSSGTINFSGLTASRMVATDSSKNLVSTITAANLASSITAASANAFLVGPTSGGAAAPSFRAIVAADVPFLQAGTGATTRTMQEKARESVSIMDFGAVCDNSTSDSAAIQAALDYSQIVTVPAGDNYCMITTAISVPSGASIVREAGGVNLNGTSNCFKKTGTGDMFDLAGGYVTLNGVCFVHEGATGKIIDDSGTRVGGNKFINVGFTASHATNTDDLVYFQSSSNTVTGARFANLRPSGSAYALKFNSVSSTIDILNTIQDSYFAGESPNAGLGVYIGSTDASTRQEGFVMSRNQFVLQGAHALMVTAVLSAKIIDNEFDQAGNNNIVLTPNSSSAIDLVTIQGNLISTPLNQTTGVGLQLTSNAYSILRVIVTGNLFSYSGYGLVAYDNTTGLIVSNNVFNDMDDIAVVLDETNSATLTGNIFTNIGSGNYNYSIADGAAGGPFIITNNIFDPAASNTLTQTTATKFTNTNNEP